MAFIVLVLASEEHRYLITVLAHNQDAKLLKRVQIVLGLSDGVSPCILARRMGCHRATIYRMGARFSSEGIKSLEDGRAGLGGPRMTPAFLAELGALIEISPREHGWERNTWSLVLFTFGDGLSREGADSPLDYRPLPGGAANCL